MSDYSLERTRPAPDSEVGPRVRGERRATRRSRVGRAGRDALADHREAAQNGLYSFDFIAQCFSDPTGLLMCLVNEEMSWGDAGIALAIFGSTLAVAGIFANGTPDQIGEWIPQCFGTPDDIKLAVFGVSEPDAGSDVASRNPAGSTTRPRTSGC